MTNPCWGSTAVISIDANTSKLSQYVTRLLRKHFKQHHRPVNSLTHTHWLIHTRSSPTALWNHFNQSKVQYICISAESAVKSVVFVFERRAVQLLGMFPLTNMLVFLANVCSWCYRSSLPSCLLTKLIPFILTSASSGEINTVILTLQHILSEDFPWAFHTSCSLDLYFILIVDSKF